MDGGPDTEPRRTPNPEALAKNQIFLDTYVAGSSKSRLEKKLSILIHIFQLTRFDLLDQGRGDTTYWFPTICGRYYVH